MLSNRIKNVVRKTFPKKYQLAQEALRRYRLKHVTRVLARKHGLVVLTGPFQGMKYLSEAVCSSLTPKLLGSYESELHEALAQIIAADYETVVDIGCAEGFYAVGLALRLQHARVYAFDIDARARELCRELAAINQVSERITIQGECDHKGLQALLGSPALIVSDCEGCELGLLDPALVPGLKTSDLLVELHDMFDDRITPTLMARFCPTHDITLIDSAERDPSLFPELKDFSLLMQRTAVAEFRHAQARWAYMRAKRVSDQLPRNDW
jgi:SAM-dependent methyltransferase